MRHHGHVDMSPRDPRRSSGTVELPPRRRQPPNGSDGGGGDGDDTAKIVLPVSLNLGTIVRLTLPLMVTVLGAFSAAAYYVHTVTTHMGNPVIHLGTDERAKLETKDDAQQRSRTVIKVINSKIDLRHREAVVEQREQIDKLGEQLKRDQRKVLIEVQATRREMR